MLRPKRSPSLRADNVDDSFITKRSTVSRGPLCALWLSSLPVDGGQDGLENKGQRFFPVYATSSGAGGSIRHRLYAELRFSPQERNSNRRSSMRVSRSALWVMPALLLSLVTAIPLQAQKAASDARSKSAQDDWNAPTLPNRRGRSPGSLILKTSPTARPRARRAKGRLQTPTADGAAARETVLL